MAETVTTPFCRMQGISKQYGGISALHEVDFQCERGHIHAILGENGAGKSTLIKILSGVVEPSQGTLMLEGESVRFRRPRDASEHGIVCIFQELSLLPDLSVADNICITDPPRHWGLIDQREQDRRARALLAQIGCGDVHPRQRVRNLSLSRRQMVEIAKALARNARVIAFDEPTSSLSAREIENLFRVIRELREEGRVILYVSHRMEEIFALSDAITVFKDGRYVCTFDDMEKVDHDALVQAMVGRDIGDIYGWKPRPYGEVRLALNNVKAPGVRKPVDLTVKSGEIVGLFGLVGAGRSELMKGLFGGTRITGGEVLIDGTPVTIREPSDAIKAGMMLCPEDRKADGIIPVHSVQENINISARRKHISIGCLINKLWERENADHHIRALNIKTPGAEQLIMNLSGGNQQKAILGRWLSEEMKVILLDEPTRGIDVGAKHEIYNVIYTLASQGVAVLFASSDLPEVLGVADRIIVMCEGEIAGELTHDEATEKQALSLAMPKASQAVA